jgi:hypothetical protein
MLLGDLGRPTMKFDDRLAWWFNDSLFKAPEVLNGEYVARMLNNLSTMDGAPKGPRGCKLTQEHCEKLLSAIGRRDGEVFRDFLAGAR